MKIFVSKIFIILMVVQFFSSCSTIRMRYEAKFKTDSSKKGEFVFEKSYPIGGTRTWCFLTCWIYGGACWGYLLLPNNHHTRMVEKDARIKLGSLAGTSIQTYDIRTAKVSWDKLASSHNISISGNNGNQMQSAPSPAKSGKESKSKGFLR